LLEIAGTYFGAANQSLAASATDLWSIQDVVTASPASLSGSTAITHISEASGNVVTLTLASQTTFNTAGVLVTLSGFPSGAGSWLNGYVVNLTTAASTSITFTDPSGHGTLSFTVLTGTPVITEVSGQSALTFTYAGSQPTGGTYATVAFPNAAAATSTTTNWSPTIQVSANYWTGSASAQDTWAIFSSLAAGTNGAPTLNIQHIGSIVPTGVLGVAAAGHRRAHKSVTN
jgi:hypothetical protein